MSSQDYLLAQRVNEEDLSSFNGGNPQPLRSTAEDS